MNVYGTSAQPAAQIVRQNLHVAGQHDEIALGLPNNLHQTALLLRLGLRSHGQVNVGDVVRFNELLQVGVVRHNGRNIHFQFACAMAVKQVVQAMIKL